MSLNASVSESSGVTTASSHSITPNVKADEVGGLRAHIVFDHRMRVLGRNEGAAWLADTSWSGIRIHNRVLVITPCTSHTQLRSLACGQQHNVALGVEIPLESPRLRAEYTALVDGCLGRSVGLSLLTVVSTGRSHNYIAIAMRLGLSPAEAGLMAALCTKSSLVEHAQQRKVRPQTVRSQMKSVLRKLGVHSQLEAVRLLLRLAYGGR